jgi:formylglycine-generating enzyme required for sulfatase activity
MPSLRALGPILSLAVAGCAEMPPPLAPDGPDPDTVAAREPLDAMVLVPAGPFLHGCSGHDERCFDNEKPARRVFVSAFYLDRTEVTVDGYAACVASGGCSEDGVRESMGEDTTHNAPGGENTSHLKDQAPHEVCNWGHKERSRHPMNCVSWHQATAFCAWAEKRLPTEAEWEKAARGDADERIYAWGDRPPACDVAVMSEGGHGCGKGTTARVGSRPRGASPYGLLDMTGNVWEWTADLYDPAYYAQMPDADPRGPAEGRFRVIRGGGLYNAPHPNGMDSLRVTNRYSWVPEARFEYLGFRCARSASAPKKVAAPGPG